MPMRQRLYVDGLYLARHACEAGDRSLNWLDLGQLAGAIADGPINACYFGAFDPEAREMERATSTYASALRATGVACSLQSAELEVAECHRCGHGWENMPAHLLDLDITLAVTCAAADDEFDRAYVAAPARLTARLKAHFATRFPSKTIVSVRLGYRERSTTSADGLEVGLAALRAARFGRVVRVAGEADVMRPRCWAPGGLPVNTRTSVESHP